MKRFFLVLTSLPLLIALCASAKAVEGNLKWLEGSVFDSATGHVIPGATVEILQGGTVLFTRRTDDNGVFMFFAGSAPPYPPAAGDGIIPPGVYMVKASAAGYFSRFSSMEFPSTDPGEYLSFSLDAADTVMNASTTAKIPIDPNGHTQAYEPFGAPSEGLKVFVDIPAGTFGSTGLTLYAAPANEVGCCRRAAFFEYDFKKSLGIHDIYINANIFVADSSGKILQGDLPKAVTIGFGTIASPGIGQSPRPTPEYTYYDPEVYRLDEKTGEWKDIPGQVLTNRYGLITLWQTNHFSRWKTKTKKKRVRSCYIESNGSTLKLEVWSCKEGPKEGDELDSVEVGHGGSSGRIETEEKGESDGLFADSETLSTEIGSEIGATDIVTWGHTNASSQVTVRNGKEVWIKSSTSRKVTIPDPDHPIPQGYVGEIKVVEKGYDCWLEWRLKKNGTVVEEGETDPVFVVFSVAVVYDPPLE